MICFRIVNIGGRRFSCSDQRTSPIDEWPFMVLGSLISVSRLSTQTRLDNVTLEARGEADIGPIPVEARCVP